MPSGTPSPGTGDVRDAWGRVTAWLERNDPAVFAALGAPGSPAAIGEAEQRMGLMLPGEMRQWLLMNDVDAGGHADVSPSLVARGCAVDLPGGHLLLGLGDIERVYFSRMGAEEAQPSEDPDHHPLWRREWVPVAAERDGLYGTFLDTRDGTIGTWAEAAFPEEGVYASLFAFFHEAADLLEGVSSGDWRGPGAPDGRAADLRPEDERIRLWARAHGHTVHARGRVPAEIRDAYEQPLT